MQRRGVRFRRWRLRVIASSSRRQGSTAPAPQDRVCDRGEARRGGTNGGWLRNPAPPRPARQAAQPEDVGKTTVVSRLGSGGAKDVQTRLARPPSLAARASARSSTVVVECRSSKISPKPWRRRTCLWRRLVPPAADHAVLGVASVAPLITTSRDVTRRVSRIRARTCVCSPASPRRRWADQVEIVTLTSWMLLKLGRRAPDRRKPVHRNRTFPVMARTIRQM
jgi:hypothetical protein